MRVSICFPQYNRIQYLLKSLSIISEQSYDNIEITISDDASSDNTEELIRQLQNKYRFPIIYFRNDLNTGYDRNYRKALELATGDYCLVLGNDDSLNGPDAIEKLVKFIKEADFPDVGFCNFVEERNPTEVVQRAHNSIVLGSGPDVALKYYSCFSFVAGIIYKKNTFDKFNVSNYDGSIYAQIALGCAMICSGAILFSIKDPLVIKDLILEEKTSNSYRDSLPRKWSEYKKADGGLKSVIHVLFSVFTVSGTYTHTLGRAIFRKIYRNTLPFWILDYKFNSAIPAALGIFNGMKPWTVIQFQQLRPIDRIGTIVDYYIFSLAAGVMPSALFYRFKNKIYALVKK